MYRLSCPPQMNCVRKKHSYSSNISISAHCCQEKKKNHLWAKPCSGQQRPVVRWLAYLSREQHEHFYKKIQLVEHFQLQLFLHVAYIQRNMCVCVLTHVAYIQRNMRMCAHTYTHTHTHTQSNKTKLIRHNHKKLTSAKIIHSLSDA